MGRNRKTRADLRGKPLDKFCHKAKTTTHERGPDDNRVFCFGLIDLMTDEYIDACRSCGALVWNEQSLFECQR